jgi:hypothetical protein
MRDSKANYVISGEQRTRSGGCAHTYSAEAARSSFYQWPTGTGRVHARFSLVAKFYSHVPATHGICSYLVDRRTRQTYARAERFWTNSYAPAQGSTGIWSRKRAPVVVGSQVTSP